MESLDNNAAEAMGTDDSTSGSNTSPGYRQQKEATVTNEDANLATGGVDLSIDEKKNCVYQDDAIDSNNNAPLASSPVDGNQESCSENNNNENENSENCDENAHAVDAKSNTKSAAATSLTSSSFRPYHDNSAAGTTATGHSPATETPNKIGYLAKASIGMAHRPCRYLTTATLVTLTLSVVGIVGGNFSVAVDNAGWTSRNTLVSNRQTQWLLVDLHRTKLFQETSTENDETSTWDYLLSTVQPGVRARDQLHTNETTPTDDDTTADGQTMDDQRKLQSLANNNNSPGITILETAWNATGCSIDDSEGWEFYANATLRTRQSRLWPVWKYEPSTQSAGAATTLFRNGDIAALCRSERATLQVLQQEGLCLTATCEMAEEADSEAQLCLPPISLVLWARLHVPNGLALDCDELQEAVLDNFAEEDLQLRMEACIAGLLSSNPLDTDGSNVVDDSGENATTLELDSLCEGLEAFMVDEYFVDTGHLEYSSSIFPTRQADVEKLYARVDTFDRGGGIWEGAYGTQKEDFVGLLRDESVGSDMMLAMGSAFVTLAAILIHTRSLFVSLIGLLQIVLSFPLAFFVYTFIAGLEFFPFLNFIGVFVVFALGADDIFVAVDKWKNARIALGSSADVTEVASRALPDAATSMFLTTLTTAVAFLGTAVCPVAPIRCFAVFCGLLIVFDYILCVVLVFPALCIYDTKRRRNGKCQWFWSWENRKPENIGLCERLVGRCFPAGPSHASSEPEILTGHRSSADSSSDDYEHDVAVGSGGDDRANKAARLVGQSDNPGDSSEFATNLREDLDKTPALIRRILGSFYVGLHKLRWVLLAGSAAAMVASGWYASDIPLPTNGDVRVLQSDIEYEISYQWRQHLLNSALDRLGGGSAYIVFGSRATDTGDHNNPAKFSQLVLDDTFQPSEEEAQAFLLQFCIDLFDNEWAIPLDGGSDCSMLAFHNWLGEQGTSASPSTVWTDNCNGSTGLPVPQETFDECILAWSRQDDIMDDNVLIRNGKVDIIHIPFESRVRSDSPFEELDSEWGQMESWMEEQRASAPPGLLGDFYHTAAQFWWYDTNNSLLQAAFTGASIAIGTGAIVILASSRSFTLTIFSAATIVFVLASVTACLVSLGWTLGFLESICFAILIGISCDFVIHFSHAYASLPGKQHRSVRTKSALIEMGPSILAAAFTTMAAATIMLFTVISFFVKFAVVLFLTVVMATVGSFIVFLTLADCVGPAQPTALVDKLVGKCRRSG